MSGGMWNYLSQELDARADDLLAAAQGMMLLAVIEHELDWGISGDTCHECAKLRAVAALEQFFSDNANDASAAMALARDGKQNLCPGCTERLKQRVMTKVEAVVHGYSGY